MEDPIAPISQKRPLEDDNGPPVSTPVKAIESGASTPLSVLSHIQTPSPLKSTASSSIAPDSSIPFGGYAVSSQTVPVSSSTPQPAKRRKLTQKEKDDQRMEKEAKAKARADKKAQKEAEDKIKAEQKAQKEEEKRKKIEERDEKKRQKEEEQQQKEDEKAKKERAQMKLNAFFVKPKVTGLNAGQATVDLTQNPITPPVSLLSDAFGASTDSVPPSPQKTLVKNAQSDYERYFLPFNLAAHVILAPKNAFLDDPIKLKAAQTRLDNIIGQEDVCMKPITLETFKSSFRTPGRRGLRTASVVEVIECVNGSSDRPIDLTNSQKTGSTQPLDMLRVIPMKYLHFSEDVRPPYYGTYTKFYKDAEAARLARNPLSRMRQDTNYDYDSEAEWDEPEEGEDLDSDGEDDADEGAEDEMDGFLDDEEDPQVKRRLVSGDLMPVSTGLCWEDPHGVSRLNDGSDAICTDFKDFTMGFLLEPQLQSIDPFSTAYWTPEPTPVALTIMPISKHTSSNSPMNPPRAPLAQRTMNGLLNTLNPPQQVPSGTSKAVKAKRLIPAEHLPAFKAEIEGKDLTKIGMVEALKKVFPKLPKDAITNTLSAVAARVGPTEKEKRWVLINN